MPGLFFFFFSLRETTSRRFILQYIFCFTLLPLVTAVTPCEGEAEPNLCCILCLPSELQSLITGSRVPCFHLWNSPLGEILSCSSEPCHVFQGTVVGLQ